MTIKDRARLMLASAFFRAKDAASRLTKGEPMPQTAAAPGKIYEFTMRTIDGKDKPLSEYKGQVLLIVNVASECGFTAQYETLEQLHRAYKDKGLRVLGFPANEFGAQEPGSDAQIAQFCRAKFSIAFDMFSKIVVKGPGIHPLYKFLTTESGHNGDIPWNFSKFLIDRHGQVIARFGPQDDPMAQPIVGAIESVL